MKRTYSAAKLFEKINVISNLKYLSKVGSSSTQLSNLRAGLGSLSLNYSSFGGKMTSLPDLLEMKSRSRSFQKPRSRSFSSQPASSKETNAKSSEPKQDQHDSGNSSNWFAIPVSVGIVYIGLMQLYKISKRPDNDSYLFSEVKKLPIYLRVYAAFPLRFISQCWGSLNDLTLPVWARSPIYRFYAYLFGCNLDEMKVPVDQLSSFENLGQFFYRELKGGARLIDTTKKLVSPSDGKILYCGKMINGEINKVKNASYLASNLMGPPLEKPQSWLSYLFGWKQKKMETYEPSSSSSDFYYAVIYLAPGDYHRFHSPVSWNVKEFRHFYGEMFSVSPWLVSKFPTLFTLNERVACLGNWTHGFFGMTAVAATNVGKIKINALPDLETNSENDQNLIIPHGVPKSLTICDPAVQLKKGQEMGGFKLGSTVVLVFEAPKSFAFNVKEGDAVHMGQSIGNL